MATFYFNGAADLAAELPTDWQTLGNWWMDDAFTSPAAALPASTDNVIAVATIGTNSGSAPTVANFTLNDLGVGSWTYLGIDITVTGLCIFNSTPNYGNITGDCIFNNASNAVATITGNCTFNGTSTNYGAITGNCIFNDTATNASGLFNPALVVTGDCTFNDNTANSGNITANCTFNDTGANYGPITGDCTFNDDSFNNGPITGDCVFNDSSYNPGFVNGSVVYSGFTGTSSFGTFLNGKKQFYFNAAVNNEWTELGNWWMDDQFSVQATALPTSTDDVIVNAEIASNSGSEPTVANATFVSGASNGITIAVTGHCTFDGAHNYPNGNITGDCTFNNGSNLGTITGNCDFNGYFAWHSDESWEHPALITGDCTFNGGAGCSADIIGDCTFNDGSLTAGFALITGNCTFNGTSSNAIAITGNCTFNDYAYTFNPYGSSPITGNCTFNDSSYNNNVIYGDCTFNGYSGNSGTVYGNATFNGESLNPGRVDGLATFNDSSRLFLGVWDQVAYVGSVGAAVFSLSAAALNMKDAINAHRADAFGTYGTVEFKYDKGINGSSILGVV